MNLTGRRALLILALLLGLHIQVAASFPLIVQISPTASITKIASSLGGSLLDAIPGANTYLLDVPSWPSAPTSSLLGIQSMEPNTGVTLPGFAQVGVLVVPKPVPPDWYKHQPAMQLIRAGEALQYSTGRAVVVADINAQVDYAHPALIGHLTSGYDFVTDRSLNGRTAMFINQSDAGFLDQSDAAFLDQSEAAFLDQSEAAFLDSRNPAYSHATICAGIIATMAPDSMIMPLRAFDDLGRSDIFTIAKAIQYGVRHGAQVINMSFGTTTPSLVLTNALNYATNAGVTLVAAAGNDNTSNPQYPAASAGVLNAAATDLLDRKASFSNYGSSVFVTAPGVDIISAYPGGYYAVVSGTSFSATAVTGTAALIRSLKTSGISNSMAGGAVNIDARNPGYAHQLGYGRIDVLRAVDSN